MLTRSLVVALTLCSWSHALTGCGGDPFTLAETQGAGGSTGTSNNGSGAKSSGNGTGGSTNAGNGAGGSTNTGGNGSGTASTGAGGLDRPGCGPAPGTLDESLIFYTTLDEPAAVSNPTVGDGTSASANTTPADDFKNNGCGSGSLLLDSVGDNVNFLQAGSGGDHIDMDRGTLDFFFYPNAEFLIYGPKDFFFFTISLPGNAGAFRMRKASEDNNNHFQFTVVDQYGVVGDAQVRPENLPFATGVATRITVTWDFSLSGQQVRIYFDGIEAPYPDGSVLGDNGPGTIVNSNPSFGAPAGNMFFYIGNEATGMQPAEGLIDDFKIYDDVIVP